jgi:hypothetical protein
MKKLYFLDEEEKNRILNLHESATKRHYLNEQEEGGQPAKVNTPVDDVNNAINAVKNPGSQPETFGFPNNQNAAAGIKAAQDMLKNFNFGGTGTQATGTQSTGTQSTGTQATGTQATGTQATGTQSTGTQSTGTQSTGTQSTGTQATGTQSTGTQSTGTPAPATWSPDPTGNKTWEYQFKDGKWWARKIGQTKEFDISTNAKYASSVNHLNKAYPEAIKPVTSTTTNTTPVNTVVGGDPNSEVAKKTAEANASTSVASNTTPSSSQNAQPAAGGTNFTDVDNSEFS